MKKAVVLLICQQATDKELAELENKVRNALDKHDIENIEVLTLANMTVALKKDEWHLVGDC